MKPEPSVRANVIANFAGKAWSSLVSLLVIPVYLKHLGIEAYGLIGVYVSLTALLSFMDMGLSSTLSRQLARLSIREDFRGEGADLVRTFEYIYWGTGLLIGIVIACFSSAIAQRWLNPGGIGGETTRRAILLMAVVATSEWPAALYTGGHMGLQCQGRLNVLKSLLVTLQAGGAAIVLHWVSPTITAFFVWQAIATMTQTLVLMRSLRSQLRADRKEPPRFNRDVLRNNWHFAVGMTGITVLSALVTQIDKILLSRLLPLEAFGYYTLAVSVAGTLGSLVQPFFSALFPRFTQMVAHRDEAGLSRYYHAGCRAVATILFPVGITLALFSAEILDLWMANPETTRNTAQVLGLLFLSGVLNSLLALPFALQLSVGWTRLSLYKNILALPVMVALLTALIPRFGAPGAAIASVLYHVAFILAEIPFMHRRILPREMKEWYLLDVGLPAVLAGGIGLLSRGVFPLSLPPLWEFLWIVSTVLAGLATIGWINARKLSCFRIAYSIP